MLQYIMLVIVVSGIIQSSDYDHAKYVKLCRLVDGRQPYGETQCKIDLDNFKLLKQWFDSVSAAVSMLSRLPQDCCSLCSAITGCSIVRHGHSGCPRIFNHCYKCIGKHAGSACSSPLFRVPRGFCWTCWMPLQKNFGFQFHSECVGSCVILLQKMFSSIWQSFFSTTGCLCQPLLVQLCQQENIANGSLKPLRV